MGTVMKDLDLLEACPYKLCTFSHLTWWLRLQLTNKTMRSVLHQFPLCINCGRQSHKAPALFTASDLAWAQLLLCCSYPIATVRCACLLPRCRRVLCGGLGLGSCGLGPPAALDIKCLTGLGEQYAQGPHLQVTVSPSCTLKPTPGLPRDHVCASARTQCISLQAARRPAHCLVCGQLHPGTCEHLRFAHPQQGQPMTQLRADLQIQSPHSGSLQAAP